VARRARSFIGDATAAGTIATEDLRRDRRPPAVLFVGDTQLLNHAGGTEPLKSDGNFEDAQVASAAAAAFEDHQMSTPPQT